MGRETPDDVLPEPQPPGVNRWLLLAASAVLVFGLSLLAIAGVGAFAVYTWGWRDQGGADERRIAEASSRAVLAARCGQRPCITQELMQEAPRMWRVRLAGAVNECHLIDLDRFVTRGGRIEGASRVPCSTLPLRNPWLTVAVATSLSRFLNPPLDAPSGFERDVVQELARRLRISEVRWRSVPPGALLRRALRASDMSVGRILVPALEPRAQFSSPYYLANQALLVRRGRQRHVRAELREETARLGVIRVGFRPPYDGATTSFATIPQALTALGDDRIDGFVIDIRSASVEVAASRRRLAIAGQWSTGYGYAFAMRNGNPLVGSVNASLAAMREDGTLAEIQERWFPETTRAPMLG
jgi:polar amino acid transport system substrate-binding protein